MIDKRRLFISTLDDIRARESSATEYEVLGIAALLRKLFLDGGRLVDQINEGKIKLAFETTDASPPEPDQGIWSVQDGLDPNTAAPHRTRLSQNRDQFLSRCIAQADGHRLSVRDVINFEAHVDGGVHAGLPKNEAEKALFAYSKFIQLEGQAIALRQLRAIARVTLRALEPLKASVESSLIEKP